MSPGEFIYGYELEGVLDASTSDQLEGYKKANGALIEWIDRTLATAKNFEELKSELTTLLNGRLDFVQQHDFLAFGIRPEDNYYKPRTITPDGNAA